MTLLRALFVIGFVALSGCGRSTDRDASPNSVRTLSTITIVGENGLPLSGAKVLIGKKQNVPFQDNFFAAQSNGTFIAPAAWNTPQDITIEAPGYVRTTFVDSLPSRTNYVLAAEPGQQKLEVSGPTTHWEALKNDGIVDFGLVMQQVEKRSIFSFNVPDLLSSEVDTISAMGQTANVPSNFSIPKQTESYSFIPVTVEKLKYRTYVRKTGGYSFYVAKGKFPFKDIRDVIEGRKSYFEVLNKVDFIGGGVSKLNVTAQTAPLDLDVSMMKYSQVATAQAGAIPKSFAQMVAIWNQENGLYYASDAKTVLANETKILKGSTSSHHAFLSIQGIPQKLKSGMVTLKEQMSRVLMDFTGSATFKTQHLEVIAAPKFDGQMVSAAPPVAAGFVPAGSYMIFSDMQIVDTETNYYELKNPLWEVYAATWMKDYELPQWPTAIGQSVQKRLEVGYLANATTVVEPGPEMLTSVTHVTKNAVDF